MLEICFNNSVGGGLKVAKFNSNQKSGRTVVASVIVSGEDQHPLDAAELEAYRRKAQEQMDQAWEEAIPLGGEPKDVFCFPLAWSYGDVSESLSGEKRRKAMRKLYGLPEDMSKDNRYGDASFVSAQIEQCSREWQRLLANLEKDEKLRIWYAPWNPDDVCGLYWFLWMLKQKNIRPKIWLMRMPEYMVQPDGSMIISRGWGEMGPEEYGRQIHLQEEMCNGFFTMAVMNWEQLRQENAPLRAVVNGKLSSVAEDFYDGIIRSFIEKEAEEFAAPILIGRLLGNSCLSCVGDGFIYIRLMAMVESGELEVSVPGEDGSYRGLILRKIKNRKES